MTRRLLLPLAALAAFAVAASPASAKQVKLTIADSGQAVSVHKGDTILVTLASNQTTPFHWAVTTKPKSSVLKVASSKYVAPGQGVPGQGGTQVYKLKATGKGSTTFTAEYVEI